MTTKVSGMQVSTCHVGKCGRTIIGDPLVLSIKDIVRVSEGALWLEEIRLENFTACRQCVDAVVGKFPDTRFFSLSKTRVELERLINRYKVPPLNGALLPSVEIKTVGKNGRPLAGAAANHQVRRVVSAIVNQEQVSRNETEVARQQRLDAVVAHQNFLAVRNEEMTRQATGQVS